MADTPRWHYYAHLSCPVAGGYWDGYSSTAPGARKGAIIEAHEHDCDADAWVGACEGCPAQRTPEQAEKARRAKAERDAKWQRALKGATTDGN